MDDYDALFDATATTDSVFADKQALNPLTPPDTIRGRDNQERALARILGGIHEGYLPPTVTIHGPPGTGKTATTRRVCEEFAARHDIVAVEYVNLKECRTIFSAASEIHLELTGDPVASYEGLDGAFTRIWDALADYPAWTVLILDEIDQIKQDSNYDPSEFLYRLLRGEGRLKRGIDLSAWLISNELLEVDLRLDSRVESAMSDETVFFPPYGYDELAAVVGPMLDRAFHDEALSVEVREYGLREVARRWGDARKTLRLFRRAGETATEDGSESIRKSDVDANLETTDKESVINKLSRLPNTHLLVLVSITGCRHRISGEIVQPVTSTQARDAYEDLVPTDEHIGERAFRKCITDLETMGLIETWIDSRGNEGRIKQIETAFDPTWVGDAIQAYADAEREVIDEQE